MRRFSTLMTTFSPSLWRLPFTLATIWGIHISMTPPNKRPPDHELELNNIQNKASSDKGASSSSVKKRRNIADIDIHEDKSGEDSQLTALERRRESVLTTYIPPSGKVRGHWVVFASPRSSFVCTHLILMLFPGSISYLRRTRSHHFHCSLFCQLKPSEETRY